MEPNKIDTQIQERLSKREIKPSIQSWDRLDAMLTLKEEQKTPVKPSFKWWYVAASIVLFLGIGLFNYESNAPTHFIPENTVVSTDEVNGNRVEEKNSIHEKVVEQKSITNTTIETISTDPNTKQLLVTVEKNEVNKTPVVQSKNEMLAINESPNLNSLSVEELISIVDNANSETKANPNIKVNANSLLNSIEKELNKDYKETKMEKVSRNFYQIKTALANRNYEEN